ncbi:putative 3-oxoacyl-(Acyl-carrier-protein) synthase [Mycobacterium xenopi 3993]|nr:putative 3-oxoacyl-(Acyl-carrier-protein) synthase [Mycobacterium xenopi 3993]
MPRCRPAAWVHPAPPPQWDDLDIDPADLVVIVGGAELGPYGSSRTRFEMEVDNELSAAGVLELAWTTGLIRWHDDPSQAGMTPNPVSWSTNPSSSSATTTPWWNGSGSASGSTTARSTPTTPRRFWSACFGQGLHVRGVQRSRGAGVRAVRPRPHADPAGARFH